MVRPIQRVIQPGVQAAGDRNISLSERIPRLARQGHGRRRGTGEGNEFDHIPSIQWELQDAGVFHNFTDTRIPGFYQGCVGLNLDRLGDLSHFQDHIDDGAAVDFQNDSALYIHPKPRQGGLQPIWANRQVRQNVGSGFIGNDGASNPGTSMSRRDFHARKNRGGRVLDSATNLGRRLCPDLATVQNQNARECQCREDYFLHS